MNTKLIISKIEELAQPAIERLGFGLVDIEFKNENSRWILRIYIDKEGGITLDDCERATKEIDHLLDEADPIPVSYNLEVSSPGLDRVLKKKEDFDFFAGREVKIKTYSPIQGQKNFTGKLDGTDGDTIIITTEDKKIVIPMEQIAKANLNYRF